MMGAGADVAYVCWHWKQTFAFFEVQTIVTPKAQDMNTTRYSLSLRKRFSVSITCLHLSLFYFLLWDSGQTNKGLFCFFFPAIPHWKDTCQVMSELQAATYLAEPIRQNGWSVESGACGPKTALLKKVISVSNVSSQQPSFCTMLAGHLNLGCYNFSYHFLLAEK